MLDLVNELLILLERDRIRRQDRPISASLHVALFLDALVQLCVKRVGDGGCDNDRLSGFLGSGFFVTIKAVAKRGTGDREIMPC